LHQEVWLDAFRGVEIPSSSRGLFAPGSNRIAPSQGRPGLLRDGIREERAVDSLAEAQFESAESNADFRSSMAEALHKALEGLPPRHREILVLHYLRDLNHTRNSCHPGPARPATVKKPPFFTPRIELRNIVERKHL